MVARKIVCTAKIHIKQMNDPAQAKVKYNQSSELAYIHFTIRYKKKTDQSRVVLNITTID